MDNEVLTHVMDVVTPKRLCSGTRAVMLMETGLWGLLGTSFKLFRQAFVDLASCKCIAT